MVSRSVVAFLTLTLGAAAAVAADRREEKAKKLLAEIESVRQQAEKNPDDLENRKRLGVACLEIANLYLETGKIKEASTALSVAAETLVKLYDDKAKEIEVRPELASTYESMAQVAGAAQKRALVFSYHQKLVDLRRSICKDFPTDSAHRRQLGKSLRIFGNTLAAYGKSAEGEKIFREGAQVLTQLHEDTPDSRENLNELVNLYTYWSGACKASLRKAQAAQLDAKLKEYSDKLRDLSKQ